MNYSKSFYIKPISHEIVETDVSLSVDQRPAVVGSVVDSKNKPLSDALITIYLADDLIHPIGAVYSDESGGFVFGPLNAGELYYLKVFKSGDLSRQIEQTS